MTNLTVIGVGMIGGSFALAMKRALGDEVRVAGLVRREEAVRECVDLGVCDFATVDAAEAVRDADLVYFATPVLQIVPIVERVAPHLKPGCVVTDAASTKSYIYPRIVAALPAHVWYVSGHPMTGKEHSGVRHADADLFRGKCYVAIRDTTAPPDVYQRTVDLFARTGAWLTTLDVAHHDRCASVISHVPHVVASALVTLLERSPALDDCLKLAGGGFKDTTRIASSNADMWSDICATNGAAIAADLRRVQGILGEVVAAIERSDRDAIHAYFAEAKRRRDDILATSEFDLN